MIDVRAVSKIYNPMPRRMRLLLRTQISKPVVALEKIDLVVERGDVCVVIGPNGAGKSTLFRICTGLTTPTTGFAYINGFDVIAEGRRARAHIGFAPAEERTLLMRHTVRENLAFHGVIRGMSGKDLDNAIDASLEAVEISEVAGRSVFAISTGMRARLQLARALLGRPEVLILDEPTSAIDPVAAQQILRIVIEAAAEHGTAVLLSSHRLEEIESLGDRVVLLDRGKAVYRGPLESFIEQHAADTVELRFSSAAAATRALMWLRNGRFHTSELDHQGRSIVVAGTQDVGAVLDSLDETAGVTSAAVVRPSLLDVLSRTWDLGK